jgi:hypothetical protein
LNKSKTPGGAGGEMPSWKRGGMEEASEVLPAR